MSTSTPTTRPTLSHGTVEGYQKFAQRNDSSLSAPEPFSIFSTRKKAELQRLAAMKKQKIFWFLLLTATFLVIAIAFFTATACVSLKMIAKNAENFDGRPGTDQKIWNRTEVSQFSNISNFWLSGPSGRIEATKNILSNIDFDTDPCHDFYQYACGIWPLKNPLGPDQRVRTVYTTVTRRVSQQIRQAIDDLEDSISTPRALKIVKTAYESCVDAEKMTREGSRSLLKFLRDPKNGIGAWPLIDSVINEKNREVMPSISVKADTDQTDHNDSVIINRLTPTNFSTKTDRHSGNRDWKNRFPAVPSSVGNRSVQIRSADHRSPVTQAETTIRSSSLESMIYDHIPDFTKTIAILKNRYGVDTVIFTYIGPDQAKSSANVLQLSSFMLPLGLGLFKAPYYLNDAKYGRIMDAYSELITTTGNLLLRDAGFVNVSVNQTEIDELINFERHLAAYIHKSDGNLRRKWTLQRLITEIPSFDWRLFLENLLPSELHVLLGGDQLKLDVPSKTFLSNLISLLNRTDRITVQNYLIWRLVKYSLPYLGQEYREALQKLNTVVNGAKVQAPLWESCIDYVQGRYDMPGLGYATGRIFLEKSFTAEAKKDVEGMVTNIVQSFQYMITSLDWMDNYTKQLAIEKSQKMTTNIAYPDWILNNQHLDDYYTNLSFSPSDTMFQINLKLRGWSVNKNQLQLLSATDRKDFGGPPSATNAWYSVNNNALTVPAGELQPPFYKLTYPPAVKYGAAGSVIGHELMHGFDSQGSQYDAHGRIRRLWSEESMDEFEERTKCLQHQYDKFCYPEISDRLCVDGEHTNGENTADLGGLKAAYRAYKSLVSKNDQSDPPSTPSPGVYFSDEQLFFLSFSSFWCGSNTEEAIRDQLITNHHTPAKYRVIGTLRNMPEFAQAFQCPVGSYMNPPDKCAVW